MKRGNIQRANEIDKDLSRIDELVALQAAGKLKIRFQLMHTEKGVTDEGLHDERWKEMSEGVTQDLTENFFARLGHLRATLHDELEKL